MIISSTNTMHEARNCDGSPGHPGDGSLQASQPERLSHGMLSCSTTADVRAATIVVGTPARDSPSLQFTENLLGRPAVLI
jgi:hypothetical protein